MDKEQLIRLIENHEDNFVERKPEGVNAAELRQTAGALANSVPEGRVAVIFLGVHDRSGEVIGVENPDRLQKRIREACHIDCYPPIEYRSEVLAISGKQVVAVVIPYSKKRPHFTGPAYVRIGSESVKASAQQYEELILSRVDKARELIKYKNNHAICGVRGINYHLGSLKPFSGGGHVEGIDCKVIECSGHTVTFYRLDTQDKFSESLERISIEFDAAKGRPLVNVKAPGR